MERSCSGSSFNYDEEIGIYDSNISLHKSLEKQDALNDLAKTYLIANEGGQTISQLGSCLRIALRDSSNIQGKIPQPNFQSLEASKRLDSNFYKKAPVVSLYQTYSTGQVGVDQTPPSSGMSNNFGTNFDPFIVDSKLCPYAQDDVSCQSQLDYNFSNSGFQFDGNHLDYLNTPIFLGTGPPPPTPATPFLLSNTAYTKKAQHLSTLSSTPTSAPSPFGIDPSALDSFLPPPALPSNGTSFDSNFQAHVLSLGLGFDGNNFETVNEATRAFCGTTYSIESSFMEYQKAKDRSCSTSIKTTLGTNLGDLSNTLELTTASGISPQNINLLDQQSTDQLCNGLSTDKDYASLHQSFKRVPSNPNANSQSDELKTGNKQKRSKQRNPVRELLPLLPGQASEPKTPELQPQPTEPNASESSSKLTNPLPDTIAQLKTKSNYQLLREGKSQALGLNFGDSPSFDCRRIAHKDAERVRRKQQGEYFQILQNTLNNGLSEKASKYEILCLAHETISSNASVLASQSAQIKGILSQFCSQGVPPDFPLELIEWLDPSGG